MTDLPAFDFDTAALYGPRILGYSADTVRAILNERDAIEQRALYLRDLLARLVQQTEIEFSELDDGNAPGHGHERPGIWDDTGTQCNYCKLWAEAKKAAKGLK